MLVTLLRIVTLVRLVQPENVLDPMLVTLVPIVTLVRRHTERMPRLRCW